MGAHRTASQPSMVMFGADLAANPKAGATTPEPRSGELGWRCPCPGRHRIVGVARMAAMFPGVSISFQAARRERAWASNRGGTRR